MSIRDYRNIHHMLFETVTRHPEEAAFRWIQDDGSLPGVTWSEFYRQVRQAAKSLIALGLERGTTIDIVSYTQYRWVLTDVAAAAVGVATVGIYHSLPAKDCRYIIDHSEGGVVFVEDLEQLAKLQQVREQLPNVRQVVLFEGQSDDDWVLTYEDFLTLGQDLSEDRLEERINQVTCQDTAAIVYTSGTTGIPKGAVLTHDNFTFASGSVCLVNDIRDGDTTFLFLPLAHAFAQTHIYVTIRSATTTVLGRSIETLAEDLKLARPHWFAAVPRVYEKVYAKIHSSAEAKGGLALRLFRWACAVGYELSERRMAKRPLPFPLGLKYAAAQRLVFSRLHQALGGRVRWCISGAAPLETHVGRFFHAAGVLILEGLGMTENCALSHVNRIDRFRFGWVGQPAPEVEHQLTPDGEVMCRGRNVMREYHKMPRETAAVITPDGWLRTGDLGEIDDQGFLRITGRKKDLIITSGGKNIAPAPLEGLLTSSKYIAQACLVGDGRRFLSALVVVDEDNVQAYARQQGIALAEPADGKRDRRIRALIDREVAAKNGELAPYETIKKVALVEEFTVDNGMLTPTMKVKRNVVMKHYARLIDSLYLEEHHKGVAERRENHAGA